MSSLCLSIAALVYLYASIPFWWELEYYISKKKPKQNRLTERQDRHTDKLVAPPRRAHTSSDAPTGEWRTMSREESPAQLKGKKKSLWIHQSPSSGEHEGKAGQRALTKDTEKAEVQSSLKAVRR